MPYRKEQFENGEFYHVLSRRPDGLPLFTDKRSYLRFLATALIINTISPSVRYALHYWKNERMWNVLCGIGDLPKRWGRRDEPLVNIHMFTLMQNHPHFLLEQVSDGGVQEFIGRLFNSYGKFFNTRNERSGPLFEGPFKAGLVEDDGHFRYLCGYIPLNGLDTAGIEWRKTSLKKSWTKAKKVLEEHPWSSYHTFMGKPVFTALLKRDGLACELFPTPKEFEEHLKSWKGERYKDITIK